MSEESKIFVGGLHWNTTTEGLKAYFEHFGKVLDCNIMRDPTGRSRCFGFVTFSDPVVVDIVLQKTHILDKKQIDPKRAVPKDQQVSTKGSSSRNNNEENKVFVGGIHIEASEDDLKDHFSKYDTVREVVLMRDRETGRSRGFGFVGFASHEGVTRACNDSNIVIKGRKVEVKMAVPKGKPVVSAHSQPASQPDPYAAWAEYFRQNPEYYEAMMKAYSDPTALASLYSQYYGQNNPNIPKDSQASSNHPIALGQGGSEAINRSRPDIEYNPSQEIKRHDSQRDHFSDVRPSRSFSSRNRSISPQHRDRDYDSRRHSRSRSRSRSPVYRRKYSRD